MAEPAGTRHAASGQSSRGALYLHRQAAKWASPEKSAVHLPGTGLPAVDNSQHHISAGRLSI